MNYKVYIIHSQQLDRYYIGYTHNLEERLSQHKAGHYFSRYTKAADDWRVVYAEAQESRRSAVARERQIKKWKSRKKIEELINDAGWSSGSSSGS